MSSWAPVNKGASCRRSTGRAMAPSPDFVRMTHRMNGSIAFVCGLTANLILIVLVLKSRLEGYRRLMIQMISVDFTFLIITGITDPILVLVDGNEVMLQNGYFRKIPQPWNLIFLSVWVFGLYFSICSICVQFVYRYLILCKQVTAGNKVLVAMLLVPILLSVGMAVLYGVGFYYEPPEERFATELLRELLLESTETSVWPGAISRRGNYLLIALASCAVMLMGTNYVIIMFCVYKINHTLKELSPSFKPATRALHAQLSKTLLVQAFSPLIVSIGPLSYVCYCILFKQTGFLSMMIMTVGFSWVPFTNATLTIIIVKQFRRRFTNWIRSLIHMPLEHTVSENTQTRPITNQVEPSNTHTVGITENDLTF